MEFKLALKIKECNTTRPNLRLCVHSAVDVMKELKLNLSICYRLYRLSVINIKSGCSRFVYRTFTDFFSFIRPTVLNFKKDWNTTLFANWPLIMPIVCDWIWSAVETRRCRPIGQFFSALMIEVLLQDWISEWRHNMPLLFIVSIKSSESMP